MTTSLASVLHTRLTDKTARVGVVGLGYVGLPLLVEFGRCGYESLGFDLDERKIAAIAEGRSYIPDVPHEDVSSLRASGRLTATTDFSQIATLDTVNICVPTPLR